MIISGRRLVVFLTTLLILVACAPAPEPTPLPTPPSLVEQTGTVYFPVFPVTYPCQPSAKKGLAALNGHKYLGYFCAGFYHTWGPEYAPDKVSVLWCGKKNDYDYLAAWKQKVPTGANIHVYVINEPDRPDQCNATKEETAVAMIGAMEHCPGCLFVGPGISAAQDGRWVAEWIHIFEDMGGDLDKIYAWSMHIYPNGTGWDVTKRIDVFCSFAVCDRPIWITEIGWSGCDTGRDDYNEFIEWLKQAERDVRVERYFAYTVFSSTCAFSSFISDGKLTAVGAAIREPVQGRPYP